MYDFILRYEASFCSTAGCSLYEDAEFAGLSLWWYGVGAFGLLSLSVLAKRIGRIVVTIILAVDTVLLIVLAATAPCTHCLFVGFLFALTFLAFNWPFVKKKVTVLFCIWLLFFGINLWATGKSFIGSWALVGNPKEAMIHVYFSPSCPKCKEAVVFYAGSRDVAFYPIVEKDGDIEMIRAMEEAIRQGVGIHEAMAIQCTNGSAWTWDRLKIAFRTLENKAHVFLAGSSGIPYVEFRGMPSFAAKELKKRQEQQENPVS